MQSNAFLWSIVLLCALRSSGLDGSVLLYFHEYYITLGYILPFFYRVSIRLKRLHKRFTTYIHCHMKGLP